MGRIIGLDIGDARTGIAVSDEIGLTARPLETIATDGLQPRLTSLLAEYPGAKVVVGRPRSLDGSLGQQATRIKQMADELEVPVIFEDETGTTAEAGKHGTDADAACVMLQGYLDEHRS